MTFAGKNKLQFFYLQDWDKILITSKTSNHIQDTNYIKLPYLRCSIHILIITSMRYQLSNLQIKKFSQDIQSRDHNRGHRGGSKG